MNIRRAVVIVLLALCLVFFSPTLAWAQTSLTIGGFVAWTFYCTCSGNFLLFLTPPRGGFYSYYTGTQKYATFRLPSPGVWALGFYNPGAACTIYIGYGCSSFIPPQGNISPIVGTSN